MLTEKDFYDYDTCVALKELGFDEKCHGHSADKAAEIQDAFAEYCVEMLNKK